MTEIREKLDAINYNFDEKKKEEKKVKRLYYSPQSLLSFIIELCDCPTNWIMTSVNNNIKFVFPQIDNQTERNYFQAIVQQAVLDRLNVPERRQAMKNYIKQYEKENSND